MRRLSLICILTSALGLVAAAAFAQGATPGATATPAVTAAPPAAPPSPSARPHGIRPAPSILPTLRLIDSGMLPTLGFLLTLTEEQKTKAQDLLSKSDEEMKPMIAAQVKAASEYIALLGQTKSNQADLAAAARRVLAADADLMDVRIKSFVAFRGLLTAEQNTRLAQELQQTASRWLPQAPSSPPPAPPVAK